MSIMEWIWMAIAAAGALMAFNTWRAEMRFHGAGMARAAGIWIGLTIAGFGAVALLIALAI